MRTGCCDLRSKACALTPRRGLPGTGLEVSCEHLDVDAEISRDGECIQARAAFESWAGSTAHCEDDNPHSSPKSSEARFGRNASRPHLHPHSVGLALLAPSSRSVRVADGNGSVGAGLRRVQGYPSKRY